jgi:HK97 family phage portal protein
VTVSDRASASRQSVVWACARLNADLMSSFPLHVYRKRTDGARIEAPTPQWLDTPSPGVDITEWLDALSMSLDYSGNAYGLVTPGTDGWPVANLLLDPDKVTVKRNSVGVIEYRYDRELLPDGLVMHVKGPCFAGALRGLNPIEYAALAVGTSLAGREYVSQFFSEGAHPTIEVIANQELTSAQAGEIKGNVMSVLSGSREPWVHGSGLETKTWQLSPVAAGFLESMQASDLDICRFMGLRQPEMVGVTMPANGALTYANIEQRGIALQQYSLGWRVRRIERALLRLTPGGQYVKLNMDALQRPDASTRASIADKRIRNGTWSRDDYRRIEDDAPIPDGTGDLYLWPPYRAFPIESDKQGGGDAPA